MQISRVQQEDAYGCGIACLAMVTGQSYKEVRSWFKNETILNRGMTWHEIGHYLSEHGYAIAWKWSVTQNEEINKRRDEWPVEPWADIHICQVRTLSNTFHFIVLLRDGICLDPYDESRSTFADYQSVEMIIAVHDIKRGKP